MKYDLSSGMTVDRIMKVASDDYGIDLDTNDVRDALERLEMGGDAIVSSPDGVGDVTLFLTPHGLFVTRHVTFINCETL